MSLCPGTQAIEVLHTVESLFKIFQPLSSSFEVVQLQWRDLLAASLSGYVLIHRVTIAELSSHEAAAIISVSAA